MNAIISDTINKPDIVSISWAALKRLPPRNSKTNRSASAIRSKSGITVCVAAGDSGSADFASNDPNWDGKAHADSPPPILSCSAAEARN